MAQPLHLARVHTLDRNQQRMHLGLFPERVPRRDVTEGQDALDDRGRRAVLVNVHQASTGWARVFVGVGAGLHVRGDLGVEDQIGQIET